MSKDIYRYFNNTVGDIPQAQPLSDSEAEHYMADFRSKLHSGKRRKSSMPFITKSIAAALAVAIIGSAVLFGMNKTQQPSENRFSVSLSAAAETADILKYTDTDHNNNSYNTLGSSVGAMTGFFMDNGEALLTKDGFTDYFASYHMENLNITGSNIRSIRFDSNKKGIYFTLTPPQEFIPDILDDSTPMIDKGLSSFSDRNTLNNSQYTFEEIRRQAPFILWPCDCFSYGQGDRRARE